MRTSPGLGTTRARIEARDLVHAPLSTSSAKVDLGSSAVATFGLLGAVGGAVGRVEGSRVGAPVGRTTSRGRAAGGGPPRRSAAGAYAVPPVTASWAHPPNEPARTSAVPPRASVRMTGGRRAPGPDFGADMVSPWVCRW
ncbi:hypothetical protein GCM10028815_30730 [Mariniluteicoccus flavus]